jgi:cellulose 1,4-beta-cellobiosidase
MTVEADGTKHGSCDKSWGSRSILGFALLSLLFWLALNHSVLRAQSCCQEVVVSGGQLVPRSGSDTEAPQPPTGLNLQANTGSSITIGWQASTDNVAVTGYKIFRNGTQVGTSTATSYADSGLQPNTSYSYTVKAYDAANNLSAASSPFSASTTPPTPTGLTATAGDASVSLSWSAASGATGYKVKRSTTSGGPYTIIASNVTSTSYNNTGLSNGTRYYYVVSAFSSNGESSNSSQVYATPQLPCIQTSPTSMSATRAVGSSSTGYSLSISNSSYGTLNWSASKNASWLSVSPSSGTAPSSLTVTVNPSGLSIGTYNGTITVSSSRASNSPQTVPFTLTIAAAAQINSFTGNGVSSPGTVTIRVNQSVSFSWSTTGAVGIYYPTWGWPFYDTNSAHFNYSVTESYITTGTFTRSVGIQGAGGDTKQKSLTIVVNP